MSNPESELTGSALPEPHTETSASGNPAKESSERKKAANRSNSSHSTGPRSEEGKRQSGQNARRRPISTRLLGFVEARTMNHEPGAALRLYEDLISPYPKAPPLLKRQFEDLARLYLELEAWERIRDAQIEHRWQQADIESRRSYHEMEQDLPGTVTDVFGAGLSRLPDSPAKFKQQLDLLEALKGEIVERGPRFETHVETILKSLYGHEMDPNSTRSQNIYLYCRRLVNPHQYPEPLDKAEIDELLRLLEAEMQEFQDAYTILLDQKTVTRSARMARLAPTREDRWMEHQGECLRRAVDRKLKFILTLLQTLGLEQRPGARGRGPAAGGPGPGSGGQRPGAGGQRPGAIPAPAGIHASDRTPAPQIWRRHSGAPCPRRGSRAAATPRPLHKNFQKRSQEVPCYQPNSRKMRQNKATGESVLRSQFSGVTPRRFVIPSSSEESRSDCLGKELKARFLAAARNDKRVPSGGRTPPERQAPPG